MSRQEEDLSVAFREDKKSLKDPFREKENAKQGLLRKSNLKR